MLKIFTVNIIKFIKCQSGILILGIYEILGMFKFWGRKDIWIKSLGY
jgi:hypothetical protein